MSFMTVEIDGTWYDVEEDGNGRFLYDPKTEEAIDLNDLQYALIMDGIRSTIQNGMQAGGRTLSMDDLDMLSGL